MYNDWEKDLSDSMRAILSITDTVLPRLITGTIHSIEKSEDAILLKLDTLSGVDYIREDETGLQGIASRVQWGNDWSTFTIRSARHTGSKTELEKRLEQIENGYFYPAFTMQAYFDSRESNNPLSVGIVKTKYLYDFIVNNPEKVNTRKSDNEFIYVKWSDIQDSMKIWRAK